MVSVINTNPFVIVWMVTYNHEKFIEQAIESVLAQKTNFSYKLYIGEDFSTDNTRALCQKLKNTNPEKIELFLNKKNIGATANGVQMYQKCFESNPKYIALLEGDDYWTDPHKLQKQIDFLEKNHEFNICYHDVFILNKKGKLNKDFINKTPKIISSKFDLAVWGNYIHTCSVVVRNNNFLENFDYEINICDYISYMYFVNDGKIKKIEETMAVYRYGEGIWSNSFNSEKQKFAIDNIHNILKTTDDDTIKEIMKLRLNSIALYSLPKYLTKIENTSDRSISFVINEKIPILILIKLIKNKIINKLKKNYIKNKNGFNYHSLL